ncbi:MAG: CehA/McbA family metallohydrolase [Sandaracinaceae bacterium]
MARRGLLVVCVVLVGACDPACIDGDEGCALPSPCQAMPTPTCGMNDARVFTLTSTDMLPGNVGVGRDLLASPGDVVLDNGVVTAVIDALDHPHYVAPTGGMLLDLSTNVETGRDAVPGPDSLSHMFQAVGLLPEDSVAYRTLTTDTGTDADGNAFAAVQVTGELAGWPDVHVATRYEIHPCEPGIRVRTQLVHRGGEPRSWTLVDAWYWSGREPVPFAPGVGRGFEQPGIISPVEDSWEPQEYFAASAHASPATTFFEVACDEPALYGFHSQQISAVGKAPRIVQPGSYTVFERFVGVVSGGVVGTASDEVTRIREALFDEEYVTVTGTVAGITGPDEVRASVILSEHRAGDDEDETSVWTQVIPYGFDGGTYSARVRPNREIRAELLAFGRTVDSVRVDVRGVDAELPVMSVAPPAMLTVSVTVDGVDDFAQVFVTPADEATRERVTARLFGSFTDCAPLLGAPHGGSPACDRILVPVVDRVAMPAGRYDLYATAGPFATVARETVELAEGAEQTVTFALTRLPLAPAGTLSGDFHVHGGASFDSMVPDYDRVQAFLASGIEVIATTDHDVVWDYADARAALSADDRIVFMTGLEATGHILFDLVPGEPIPQVIGHWNVWPLPFDPEGPYRGAPWDELAEPGTLFDRFVEAGFPRGDGVIQLNHPWAAAEFGRDLGFPRAVRVDARVPLPPEYDGTGPSLILRTPPGASFGNAEYDTQEVMNGTNNGDYLAYRAYWFYLLDQGIVRAGTANSDSHGIVDNVIATPRNLVWTDQTMASFTPAAFNADVRAGRMIGTNGPIIELTTMDSAGGERAPSVEPFAPASDAMLHLRVSAAPWVPIEEVRIVVNGEVARTLAAELSHPSDPFGADGLVRFEGDVALSELLPAGTSDAYVVVEAGAALGLFGDLTCDGIPDTSDNDGDGVVDWRDVDRNDDGVVDASDLEEIDEPPVECDPDQVVGPMETRERPARDASDAAFYAVTPGGYPTAFTNPLLLDRDGSGFSGPGVRGMR